MSKNGKAAMISAFSGIILCLAARFVTVIFFTDFNTGFLYHGSEILCNLLFFGILAVSAVSAAIFSAKEPRDVAIPEKGCVVLGALLLLSAFFAGYEGVMEISAPTPSGLLIVTDFAGALFMGIVAFVLLYKKEITSGIGLCFSINGAFFVLRGINIFITRTVITTVPEYLTETLGVIFSAFFFAFAGKIFSGNSEKLSKPTLSFLGVSTAVCTLSSALGVIFAKIFAPEEISSSITASYTYAETFYQSQHGKDGYIMTFTPYVSMSVGLLAIAIVFMTIKYSVQKEKTSNREEPKPEVQDN